MIWAVCAKSFDSPGRLKRLNPKGFARKKSSLLVAALLARFFFSAKSCPPSGSNQVRLLNKKPEMAPAEG